MAAPTGYNTTNVMEQGGARWDVGGTLAVNSGGVLNVENGGALQLNGTAVTATAAEINTLHSTGADSPLRMTVITFTATGAGTKAGTVTIPAGGVVQDVILKTQVQSNAGTSCAMAVGDGDAATGYINNVNLKTQTADAASAPAGISSLLSQAGAGAYAGFYKSYPSGGTITATMTQVGAGTAGRHTVTVIYAVPTSVAAS